MAELQMTLHTSSATSAATTTTASPLGQQRGVVDGSVEQRSQAVGAQVGGSDCSIVGSSVPPHRRISQHHGQAVLLVEVERA